MTKKQKQTLAELEQRGELVNEQYFDYVNIFGKETHEHARHIMLDGELWNVTVINGKLAEMFVVSTWEYKDGRLVRKAAR